LLLALRIQNPRLYDDQYPALLAELISRPMHVLCVRRTAPGSCSSVPCPNLLATA